MSKNPAFEGIENLYGKSGFKKIQAAHVLIIGIGGVGSWCAESLARSGINHLTLVDMDEICISNINRQIHALTTTVGQSKIDVMKERLLQINPELDCKGIFDFFSESSKDLLTSNEYHFIIDAIDSVESKALLHSMAQKLSIPIICIGGSGSRIDPTKIVINDLNKSVNDKLLKQLKRRLRRDYQFSKFTTKPFKIPTVFSTEEPLDGEIQDCELKSGRRINCQSGLGSASFVTATFGMIAVSYVLKKISGIECT